MTAQRYRSGRAGMTLVIGTLLGLLLGVAPLAGPLSPAASAAAGDIGHGPSTSGDGSAASALIPAHARAR